jgi:hypothetical protein
MIDEMGFWPKFVLAVLATWRVTHLLASEDGPADLIVRFRAHLGNGILGKLMDCFYCLSFWVAAPMAFFVSQRPLDLALIWLALSGAACLLERIGQEPVLIEPISQVKKGGVDYGMLRSETSDAQQYSGPDDNAGRHATRTE